MKTFIVLLYTFSLLLATEESEQITASHPLQDYSQSSQLLCQMQSNIMTYLYETPLSSYTFFNTHKKEFQAEAITTWVHGDVYINTLAAHEAPFHTLFKSSYHTHLGDYRYDLFTLLNDLLLKMQDASDFSGSKERAILGTLIDSYFDKIKNSHLQCPCIDSALSNIKEGDLLSQYTSLHKKQRLLNFDLASLSQPSAIQERKIKQAIHSYASKNALVSSLLIKGIAQESSGNYLLLCEGLNTDIRDDILLRLNPSTLPASYQIDTAMRIKHKNSSLLQRIQAASTLTLDTYASVISIGNRDFVLTQLKPSLQLKPQSEKTNAHKEYASTLGFMLASFHSDTRLKHSHAFAEMINKEVKVRQFKIEMIEMVYAYNETLERRWEHFSQRYDSSCKTQLLSDIR